MGYDGATGVLVAIEGVMAGALLLHDEIRAETPRALRLLRTAGVERIVMVTGDRHDVAKRPSARCLKSMRCSKRERICRGTEGSNPSPPAASSGANRLMLSKANPAHQTRRSERPWDIVYTTLV